MARKYTHKSIGTNSSAGLTCLHQDSRQRWKISCQRTLTYLMKLSISRKILQSLSSREYQLTANNMNILELDKVGSYDPLFTLQSLLNLRHLPGSFSPTGLISKRPSLYSASRSRVRWSLSFRHSAQMISGLDAFQVSASTKGRSF